MLSNNDAPSLLLLPAPPQPSSRISLDAAYRAPLNAVLAKLNPKTHSAILTVALCCPILKGNNPRNKTLCWKTAQSLLAGLYSIVAVVCAKEGIATDVGGGPGSVDVRVVLVDHEPKRTYHPTFEGHYESNCTAILDLAAFATKVYPWKTVYHINSEEGYEILSTFLGFTEGKQPILQHQLVVVEGGISLTTGKISEHQDEAGYGSVCLGGTFDHLHPGHKLLLHAAALLLKLPNEEDRRCELIVGISGDELLVNKKYVDELQSWNQRAQNVLSFLSTLLGYTTSSTTTFHASNDDESVASLRDGKITLRCVKIHDPFGPTITEESIEAICVSLETRGGGEVINVRRQEKGWHKLRVYEIDVLDAREIADGWTEEKGGNDQPENFAAKISSTAIRQQKAEAKEKGGVANG